MIYKYAINIRIIASVTSLIVGDFGIKTNTLVIDKSVKIKYAGCSDWALVLRL